MPFCSKCGTEAQPGTKFCSKCGAPIPEVATASARAVVIPPVGPASAPPAAPGEFLGLSSNAASTLSYLFGWISGLVFFFGDRRPEVRFHAAQSILTFGILHVLSWFVLFGTGASIFTLGLVGFGRGFFLHRLLDLAGFILWILLMVKAWNGEHFKLPAIGNWAESMIRKP
jgi:uncharacterized membrane protein